MFTAGRAGQSDRCVPAIAAMIASSVGGEGLNPDLRRWAPFTPISCLYTYTLAQHEVVR
jgi:hypothetical protein